MTPIDDDDDDDDDDDNDDEQQCGGCTNRDQLGFVRSGAA